MAEFWLISAPGDKTPEQTWKQLNDVTSRQYNLSDNHKFNIPELKVGTLDVLVGLSDDLAKLDTYTESSCRKIVHYLGEVLEDQRDKLHENLLANGLDLVTYLTRFAWDLAKYPIKQSLKAIAEIIGKQISQIETDLRTKSTAYNNLKGSLQTLERKATGSILTRNLGDIVKKDDFVMDSEYLVTLLVVVPKNQQNDWSARYETLSDMVVPRSSKSIYEDNDYILYTVTLFKKILDKYKHHCRDNRLAPCLMLIELVIISIYEDNDYILYTVTLFKKVVDEYKHHCRENRFIVRDYTYNEEDIAAGKTELSKLEADKKKQFGPLVRWLKVNFSECFTAWMHVKALRVFVESVLRYGLPVNFQAMLLQPHKKAGRRLREELNKLYSHLDNTSMACDNDAAMDIPGFNMSGADFFPYVYYRLTLDLIEKR